MLQIMYKTSYGGGGGGDFIPHDNIKSLVVWSCSIYIYDIVNNLLHTTGQAMHYIVYITFAMFSKHYLVLI